MYKRIGFIASSQEERSGKRNHENSQNRFKGKRVYTNLINSDHRSTGYYKKMNFVNTKD
jgi:hypothetical protein